MQDLGEQNASLVRETADLHLVEALEARTDLEEPAPMLAPVEEGGSEVTWCRIRTNEEGYPQLWLRAQDEEGLAALHYYREYVDENNELQRELYTRYPLDGSDAVVRFRTLDKAGSYIVCALNNKGETKSFGILATVEDVDGNGIIDTLTDAAGNALLLEIPGAFASGK